jgi:hypothetical protein
MPRMRGILTANLVNTFTHNYKIYKTAVKFFPINFVEIFIKVLRNLWNCDIIYV